MTQKEVDILVNFINRFLDTKGVKRKVRCSTRLKLERPGYLISFDWYDNKDKHLEYSILIEDCSCL